MNYAINWGKTCVYKPTAQKMYIVQKQSLLICWCETLSTPALIICASTFNLKLQYPTHIKNQRICTCIQMQVTTPWKKHCDILIESMFANVCQYQVDGLPHDVHGSCGGQVGQS